MKLKRRHKEGAEVSTESLNDIMFFLLLFFLIVSTLANPNVIKLTLPSSKNSSQLQKQKVILEVTADKKYYLNKVLQDFVQLENNIQSLTSGMQEPTIILRLDKSLTMQDLADIMQIGGKLNIKMVLATQPPNK